MSQRDLAKEIVKAVETGVNRFLKRSIIYSPFKLFYNLFKKSNPKTMDSVRQRVRDDIDSNTKTIENFNPEIFITGITVLPQGRKLLQRCYEIGLSILKTKLTVVLAFKLIRDAELRDEIYNDVLNDIINAVYEFTPKQVESEEPAKEVEGTVEES